MKKFFAIVLVVVLVFAMASVAFAAGNPVVSPEKPNTSPSVVPGGKTSPQTGESFSVVWVVLRLWFFWRLPCSAARSSSPSSKNLERKIG